MGTVDIQVNVYLIRRWHKEEGKEIHESILGVASSLARAKEMVAEAYPLIGKWSETSGGVHRAYLLTNTDELIINTLALDVLRH